MRCCIFSTPLETNPPATDLNVNQIHLFQTAKWSPETQMNFNWKHPILCQSTTTINSIFELKRNFNVITLVSGFQEDRYMLSSIFLLLRSWIYRIWYKYNLYQIAASRCALARPESSVTPKNFPPRAIWCRDLVQIIFISNSIDSGTTQ